MNRIAGGNKVLVTDVYTSKRENSRQMTNEEQGSGQEKAEERVRSAFSLVLFRHTILGLFQFVLICMFDIVAGGNGAISTRRCAVVLDDSSEVWRMAYGWAELQGCLDLCKVVYVYHKLLKADNKTQVSPWSRVQTPPRAKSRPCNSVVRVRVL
jgi:hypothetical protein